MNAVARIARVGLIALATAHAALAQQNVVWDPAGATTIPGGSSSGYYYDYAPGAVLHDGIEYVFYCSNRDSGVVVDHIALTRIAHGDGTLLAGKEIVLSPGNPESALWRHVAGVWNRIDGTLALFIDGAPAGEVLQIGKPALRPFGGFRVIGGSLNPSARNTFHGRIDELRVSKIARAIGDSTAWQTPYAADADTVDLYHFDLASDPGGNSRFLDAASPQQDGYYFDFLNPGTDIHAASKSGFGECPAFGDSIGTGSRGELFPDSPGHDLLGDAVTVEAWVCPDELIGPQAVFDSMSARLELNAGSIAFTVFFADGTSLAVAADGGWSAEPAWDAYHACDPTVVRGAFLLDGETYAWAMFYLGDDVATTMHNQIGVAFAHALEGPWVKWKDNPIVPFPSYSYWGVGQPSATSIDGAGRLLLFYTRGDTATRVVRRELDLADLAAPAIGEEVVVPSAGLTSRDGSPVVFHNADFAYDATRDVFFVSRPRHPFDSTTPSFVSSELQIAYIPGEAIWSGAGSWHVLGHLNATHSGNARNHNSGLLRDPFGGLADPSRLTALFCGSDEGSEWLWTYRLRTISGDLTGFDTTPPVIYLNGPDRITLGLGDTFVDPVTAWDDSDGDITANLVVSGASVDTSTENTYVRFYNVTDSAGNHALEVVLTVVVSDDIDEDGLSDLWERAYFQNLDQGPQDDPDGDGVSNLREQLGGTDPTDPESRLPLLSAPGLAAIGLLLAITGLSEACKRVGSRCMSRMQTVPKPIDKSRRMR